MDFSSPEGKKTLENVRKEIGKILIYERVLATEAAKAKITVSPQEVADRIAAIKKGLNLSDQGYEKFVKDNGMSLADFARQIEREILFKKLMEHGTQRGLNKDAWLKALMGRADVEILR
jgi:parvulin-like peptidyl-prolyl isomerase